MVVLPTYMYVDHMDVLKILEARRECEILWSCKLKIVVSHHMGDGYRTCPLQEQQS